MVEFPCPAGDADSGGSRFISAGKMSVEKGLNIDEHTILLIHLNHDFVHGTCIFSHILALVIPRASLLVQALTEGIF